MSRITLPSGTAAEVAMPEGPPRRGLVVVPDIMGLRPLFHDLCARLSVEHEWAVIAFEPYPGQEGLDLDARQAAAKDLDDDRKIADAHAAADHLGVEPVAVLGFCQGGMYTLKLAGTGRFDRAVAFYGMIRLPEGWRGGGQREPLEYLSREDRCPVLAVIGGEDPYTPEADVDELRALRDVEVAFFPEGQHGFVHDPSRPTHRAGDAADAWRRAAAFLRVPNERS